MHRAAAQHYGFSSAPGLSVAAVPSNLSPWAGFKKGLNKFMKEHLLWAAKFEDTASRSQNPRVQTTGGWKITVGTVAMFLPCSYICL